MKKHLFNFHLLIIITFSTLSCSSLMYSGGERSISTNTYRRNAWGEWEPRYSSLKVYQGRGSFQGMESITIYSQFGHPSDRDFEFIPTKFLGKDDKWYNYEGVLNLKYVDDLRNGLLDYYQEKKTKYDCSEVIADNCYLRFNCKILSSHPINEVIKKRSTINVFYNGVGRAYSFKTY